MNLEYKGGRYYVNGEQVSAEYYRAVSQKQADELEAQKQANAELEAEREALKRQLSQVQSQRESEKSMSKTMIRSLVGIGLILLAAVLGVFNTLGAAIHNALPGLINFIVGFAVIALVAVLIMLLWYFTTSGSKPAEESDEQSPGPAKAHQAEEVQDENQATGNSVVDRLSRYESHAPHGYKPLSGDYEPPQPKTTEQEPESKPSRFERMLSGNK